MKRYISAVSEHFERLLLASPQFPKNYKVAIYLPVVSRCKEQGLTARQTALCLLLRSELAREYQKQIEGLKADIERLKETIKDREAGLAY